MSPLWIRENGVSSDIKKKLDGYLENGELTKLRLHSIVSQPTEEIAYVLANKTGSVVVDMSGWSFLLYKPQKRY